MSHPTPEQRGLRAGRIHAVVLTAALASTTVPVSAQELIYQEGFNTDGAATNPQRYTFVGREVFEVARIQSEIGNYEQKGPIYWAHNFNTTFVGNPEIPARRMVFTWRGADVSTATEELLQLWDSSVAWLLNGKQNARVVVSPDFTAIGGLADRLTAAGHTVESDDILGIPDEQDVVGDLFIHGPQPTGATVVNASRFILLPKPVISMNSLDYDDMLLGSVGSSVTFAPGQGQATITAAGHPAAGGKTGSFAAFTGNHAFELVGSFLPPGATTLATVSRTVSPAVRSLNDVDAMIAGTMTHTKTTGTVTELDFSDSSAGSWGNDNPIPGVPTAEETWGLQVKGKLAVAAAGSYRFALGSDDGARLQIDLDKNGITIADTLLEDVGPHAHQAIYGNVVFPAAGTYDFEVRAYDSGGGGSLEVSVAVQEGEIPDDALGSGYWELLGAAGAVSPVTLQGPADATGFIATGPDVEVATPLAVLLNGPGETPPGRFYDGGPFTGFEGTGFIGGAGLNKFPDGLTTRSIRLRPVNVAGKTNVKLTIALAATVVDFETSDFIQVVVYPNGAASAPVTLADFAGVQNAVQPWLADKKENNVRRLTKQFADFTYNVPATATDLIVEIRAATTWWTEIVAFDNIRITAGALPQPIAFTGVALSGTDVALTWTGGTGPFLVQGKLSLADPAWIDLKTTAARTANIPVVSPVAFFRIMDATTKTVKLFKGSLDAAQEHNNINSPATGTGLLALDGTTATYLIGYQGLTSGLTASHLHGPAAAGADAGVLLGFAATTGTTSGLIAGQGTLGAATITALQAGNTYFNIHTATNGNGEIRGQVIPVP